MRLALAMLLVAGVAAAAFAAASLTESPEPAAGAASVMLDLRHDDGRRIRKATLSCGSGGRATGFLRRRPVEQLCRAARELRAFLAALPRHEICTEVWGGPDRARIAGHIGGDRIDRRFARRNGCEIDDWDRAQPLLPKPRGAEAP